MFQNTPNKNKVSLMYRWWKDLQIQSRLPFARDRIVECYLWMLGVYFEPSHSRGRIILTMVIAIATIFDDIFDSYGTREECELFTKCIERFALLFLTRKIFILISLKLKSFFLHWATKRTNKAKKSRYFKIDKLYST